MKHTSLIKSLLLCILLILYTPTFLYSISSASDISVSFSEVIPNNKADDFLDSITYVNTQTDVTVKSLYGQLIVVIFFDRDNLLYNQYKQVISSITKTYQEEVTVIGIFPEPIRENNAKQNILASIKKHNLNFLIGYTENGTSLSKLGLTEKRPHFLLIDPNGYYLTHLLSIPSLSKIKSIIDKKLPHYIKKRMIIPTTHEMDKYSKSLTTLNYPSHISSDSLNNRLFISDTGNNRIIVTSTDGEILDIIGSGKNGLLNGNFNDSKFFGPRGTVLNNSLLYIADSDNKLVRIANFDTNRVTSIEPSFTSANITFGESDVFYPYDIEIYDNHIYITCPSVKETYKINLTTLKLTDAFEIDHGMSYPTAIYVSENNLHILDSEKNSLFSLEKKSNFLKSKQSSEKPNLKLNIQNISPYNSSDILSDKKHFYVLDSEFSSISRIKKKSKYSEDFYRTTDSSHTSLNGALSFTKIGSKIYIANTNNHSINILDIYTKKLSTLNIHL
ncbi:hypothetical protein HOG98_01700 [bacterium]|jgi:hypothetical protein|nr:hypothetical protein [bacterium]